MGRPLWLRPNPVNFDSWEPSADEVYGKDGSSWKTAKLIWVKTSAGKWEHYPNYTKTYPWGDNCATCTGIADCYCEDSQDRDGHYFEEEAKISNNK